MTVIFPSPIFGPVHSRRLAFNISAIVAAALKDDEVLHYSAYLPDKKRKIVYVDTEQSKYHCHKIMERIMRLAGLPTDKDRDDFIFEMCIRDRPFAWRQHNLSPLSCWK